ncbi:hypothetical protein B4Q13_19670 [Lacticaseibacillus rhamnosus]
MAKPDKPDDPEFEMRFFESVLKRDAGYTEVVEILGSLYTKHGRIADGLRMDRKLVKLLPQNVESKNVAGVAPDPLLPGNPVRLLFSLTPQPVVLKSGERLRLDIASRTDLLRSNVSRGYAQCD